MYAFGAALVAIALLLAVFATVIGSRVLSMSPYTSFLKHTLTAGFVFTVKELDLVQLFRHQRGGKHLQDIRARVTANGIKVKLEVRSR